MFHMNVCNFAIGTLVLRHIHSTSKMIKALIAVSVYSLEMFGFVVLPFLIRHFHLTP